jgi:arylsulfatase A-like enzyme
LFKNWQVNQQSETIVRDHELAWWRRLAASVSPNPRVLLLIVSGWIAELVLLGCVSDNIYSVSGGARWLAIEFTAWFWVTLGWIVWYIAGRLRRPFVRAVWMALLMAAFALYGLSWGVYLRTSRFLDWDAIRFTAGNLHLLWMYARQAEHGTFLLVMAILAAVAAAVIGGGSWLTRGQWSSGDGAELRFGRRIAWYSLGLGWLLLLWTSPSSRNLSQMGREQDALRNCLHPVATLVSSWISSSLDERILPCIEPSELRPLAQVDGWNHAAHITNRANVILITIESMRHDVVGLRRQGLEVMPVVNALAQGGVQFTHAYSQTTHTDYSTTALYSSLFPLRTRRHLYFHPNDPWPKTLFYDVLKPFGYATAIISSQNEGWGGMDSFLQSPRLDLFYDPSHGGLPAHGELSFDNLPDAQTVDKAIAWVAEQGSRNEPFFLGLNLQTSHFPYKLPPDAPRPFQPSTIDFPVGFFVYPVEKVEVMRNAYYNALRECDRQIGRLVQALRANGQLSHTIIALSGDHGEAFHEQGYVSHAREPIEPVIRTACLVYAPGTVTPRVDDYPVELVDLLPTVLGLLGLPPHPNFQGIDVLAPSRPDPQQRLLFFHVENPVARSDAVLWMGRWKYTHDRQRGRASLFDVQTDPGETNDLSQQRPQMARLLRETLETWRRRQLAYYRFPTYYERYFPPAPPVAPTP